MSSLRALGVVGHLGSDDRRFLMVRVAVVDSWSYVDGALVFRTLPCVDAQPLGLGVSVAHSPLDWFFCLGFDSGPASIRFVGCGIGVAALYSPFDFGMWHESLVGFSIFSDGAIGFVVGPFIDFLFDSAIVDFFCFEMGDWMMWEFLNRLWQGSLYLFSAQHAYRWSDRTFRVLAPLLLLAWGVGLYWCLYVAPADYQQKDAFRIIYVHVPCAFLSLFVYTFSAGFSALHIIFGLKVAEWISVVAAYLGALFTALALTTGAIWGKPMWGTWWVWDARLTSELILLFLYLGYLAFYRALPDKNKRGKIAGLLLIVGVINVPIIHYSVNWWYTLHQGATLSQWAKPTMAPAMLYPLLWMIGVFFLTFFVLLCAGLRTEILFREKNMGWVQQVIKGDPR